MSCVAAIAQDADMQLIIILRFIRLQFVIAATHVTPLILILSLILIPDKITGGFTCSTALNSSSPNQW
jgi:hypothetical protein